jgi:hypothetical protein
VGEALESLRLARVGDAALDLRLARGMRRQGWIHDEAAVLCVLEEDAIEARRVPVGPGDGGRKIVDDQAAHDAAEEHGPEPEHAPAPLGE